jgi:hypothetical protein
MYFDWTIFNPTWAIPSYPIAGGASAAVVVGPSSRVASASGVRSPGIWKVELPNPIVHTIKSLVLLVQVGLKFNKYYI